MHDKFYLFFREPKHLKKNKGANMITYNITSNVFNFELMIF